MCALAGRGATARARNSARSPVVNPLQHGAGGVVHHDVAPRQYPPRDLEEPVPAHAGTARATPGEWGDVLGRPHVVEDVRAGADHGPGAEQRADRRLRMVADQAAEQLQPGLESRPRDLETHATVRVLQVRRDRAGAEVRPAADHAMADEAVVRLVRVPQEDAARQLAARVRSRADRRRANERARTNARGPIADARTGPPSTWAFAPTHKGPSSRAPARTSAPLSSTTGPFRTSKTTPGSTAASRSAIAAGSPSTALPGGSGSLSPSKARRSSGSSCSSTGTRSYTPRSTTPDTSIAVACGWGPSHTAPGPTPQPTVTPPLVRRKTPSGSAGASPRGAKVDEPITAGPGTGRRAATRGTPASVNPARWGRAKMVTVSPPTNVSHRSRIRCAPARSSHNGRAPANGAHAGAGSGSSR